MKSALRLIAFLTGTVLTIAPFLLLLSFSYGVGEPPSSDPKGILYYVWPLVAGLALGGGLLLVGIPILLEGRMRLIFKAMAAALLIISTLLLFKIGFNGSVTAFAVPIALVVNATSFFYFVYPTVNFFTNSSRAAGKKK